MDNTFFRQLSVEEKQQFVNWARDNFVPDMEVNPTWHPVVKEELARLQEEHDQANECTDLSSDVPCYDDYDQGQFDDDPNPYDGTYSEE